MDDFDDFDFGDEDESTESTTTSSGTSTPASGSTDFAPSIYKKWNRAGGVNRFLTVAGWLEKNKVSIEAGVTKEGNLSSSTKVWCNALELVVALRDVLAGGGIPYAYYGGSKVDGKPISRVLKIEYWKDKDGKADESAYAIKCGHFGATETGSGAFKPNYGEKISIDSIKASRQDLKQLLFQLELAITAETIRSSDIFRAATGES